MAASATSLAYVQKMFLAYFGRPATPTGLEYYGKLVDEGKQAVLQDDFWNSAESQAKFAGLTTEAKVTAIFQQLFARDPSLAGLQYWTAEINSGRVSLPAAALTILNGAAAADLDTFNAKLKVANALTAELDTAAEILGYQSNLGDAVAVLTNIKTGAEANAAVADIANIVKDIVEGGTSNPGDAYTLTSGIDKATANTFNADRGWTPGGTDQVNTLNDDDVLTGRGDNPTLNFTFVDNADTGAARVTPKLTGIETVNINSAGNAAKTLDLGDSSGVKALNVNRITNDFRVDNIGGAVDEFSVSNAIAQNPAFVRQNDVTFRHLDSALRGNSDAAKVTLSNVDVRNLTIDASTVGANGVGYETIDLVSAGSANWVRNFSAEDLETLNITGDQNLRIDAFGNAAGSLTKIDGSAAEGDLNLNLNGVLSAVQDGTSGTNIALNVTTGKGDDTIRITDDTIGTTDRIDTGEGDDTLALQATNTRNFTPSDNTVVVSGVETVQLTRIADVAGFQLNNPDAPANLVLNMASIAGDQDVALFNNSEAGQAGGQVTFTLINASAGDAAGISIKHSSTANNAMAQNAIVVDVADGVTTAGVEIVEGVNADPRFNFSLHADSNLTVNKATGAVNSGAGDKTNSVVNISLADNDSESNTVRLVDVAAHTGTLTVTGGAAGTFLNLDATSANGAFLSGFGHDVSGGVALDSTSVVAAAAAANPAIAAAIGLGAPVTQPSARDTAVSSVYTSVVGDQALVFSKIDAAEQTSDLVARLGLSNVDAKLGSGNDTLIFADRAGITKATSGLTIQDTIVGGEGTDTIVLDGTGVQTLGASEWTNLSGVDVIRLAGAGGSIFTLRVTDQLVDQTDAGNRITIINNDGNLKVNGENAATINLRSLAASNSVTFVGANGDGSIAGRAAQTLILNDVTANGNNFLNGGDADIVTDYTSVGAGRLFANQAASDAAWAANVAAAKDGNNNVLQIFNDAEVTIGDLANTSNFSTISFVNDLATQQTLNLTLDNDTVDRLVDASHTATATQRETLTITATDNVAGGIVIGGARLNVQADTVGAQFNLNVTGGAAADVIVGGAGNDVLNGGADNDVINGGGGNDTIIGGAGADGLTGGVGADVFRFSKNDGSAVNAGVVGNFVGFDVITDVTTAQNDKVELNRATIVLNNVAAPAATVADVATATFNANGAVGVARITGAAAADLTNIANVIAAIGAIGNETAGESAYFVVENAAGTASGIYAFTSVTANNVINAGELQLIGVSTNGVLTLADLATF